MNVKARLWPKVFGLFVMFATVSGPTGAQDLQSENEALRVEVAALRARVAELEAGVCSPRNGVLGDDQASGKVTLLRKLGAERLAQAELALGRTPGPLIVPDALLGAVVPGEYIVLTAGTVTDAANAAALIGVDPAQIVHVYGRALSGFAVRMTAAERATAEQVQGVVSIARNGVIFATGQNTATSDATAKPVSPLIDQGQTDSTVDVFLFDTGIRAVHRDLEGRVSEKGFSFFDNGIAGEDCSGHGTHVAARIAGHTLGASASARLISVKVIDRFGTGDVATVIAGIDWVMGQPGSRKLVNMSLTRLATEDPSPLDMAVQNLIDDGAVVVVAAGNSAADAADFTPARVEGAITVGSATAKGVSDFSNAGARVDIYAPGDAVTSASIRDICGTQKMSGTSMAAPLVSGLIADILLEPHSGANVVELLQKRAERVSTGAFTGETERFILDVPEQVTLRICQ